MTTGQMYRFSWNVIHNIHGYTSRYFKAVVWKMKLGAQMQCHNTVKISCRLTQMQLSKAFAGNTQPKFQALRIINELIIVQRYFIFSQSMIFYFPLTPKKEYSTFIEKHSYMLYFSKLYHIIFVSQVQVFQRSFKQFIWVPIELIMLIKLILCHFCK